MPSYTALANLRQHSLDAKSLPFRTINQREQNIMQTARERFDCKNAMKPNPSKFYDFGTIDLYATIQKLCKNNCCRRLVIRIAVMDDNFIVTQTFNHGKRLQRGCAATPSFGAMIPSGTPQSSSTTIENDF
jgi:hypothetical protein